MATQTSYVHLSFVNIFMVTQLIRSYFHGPFGDRLTKFHCSSKEPISHFVLSESNTEEGVEFPQPRRFFHRICTHGYFDLGISAVIVLNVICMAMEHYNQPEV